MVKADFTVRTFPLTGSVKDATGLPFSCVVQPYAKLSPTAAAAPLPAFMDVLRCGKCYGYINCHCSFRPPTWQCSLCNHVNDIKHLWARRYNQGLEGLPEIRSDVFEMLMDEAGPFTPDSLGDMSGPAPVLIALVDLTGSDEWLELVKSALLAALEALGLYDVRGSVPSVRYIQLREGTTQPVAIPCSQVMPLRALLAPVRQYKDQITEAIESLTSETSQAANTATTASAGATPQAPQGAPQANGAPVAPAGGLQQPGMQRSASRIGRGLGPTLLAVIEYLQAITRPPFRPTPTQMTRMSSTTAQQSDALPPPQSPLKLMTFLAGPPDWGTGRLYNPKKYPAQVTHVPTAGPQGGAHTQTHPHTATITLPPDDTWLQDVSQASTEFYEQAAVAAAALGCCCDLFAISEGAVGLRYLDPLANATGGATYMYPSLDESALPQDVYRRLSGAHASGGVLRIRCSPAFRAARHYGRLYADNQVENLHHIVSCSESDTFAMDFELKTHAGFSAPGTGQPMLQVVFQYNTVVPAPKPISQVANGDTHTVHTSNAGGETDGVDKGTSQGHGCVLQRRLRVATYKMPVSGSPLEVMRSCSSEALLVVLLHKITRVAAAQGHARARVVLRDWLANLATNYHHLINNQLAAQGPAALLSAPVDVSFAQAEALQPIPRLVYALLRSPLLAPAIESQHPDLVPFMSGLWSALPPGELLRAVYPALSSYSDPNTLVLSRHSLSRGALLSDTAPPIFLLDAYVLLVVLYTSRAHPSLPFPPPQTSAIRKALAAMRERRMTPQIRFMREGDEDSALFFNLLLDEPDEIRPPSGQDGAPDSRRTSESSAAFGLVQFLEHIRLEVVTALRTEAQEHAAKG